MKSVKSIFEERYLSFEEQAEALRKKYSNLSLIRVLTFIAGVTVIVILADNGNAGALLVVSILFLVIFFSLVKEHSKVKDEKVFKEELSQINTEELMRIEGELGSFDQGHEYLDQDHNYHIDLDIYGKNSVFQLLNRTSTKFGKNTLARWLGKPENKEIILERNEAVQELASKLDWRQEMEAHGRTNKEDEVGTADLLDWLKEPNRIVQKKLYIIARLVLPVLIITTVTLWAFDLAPIAYTNIMVLINIGALASVAKYSGTIYSKTIKSNKALKAYENQIRLIEQESFESSTLKRLKRPFEHDDFKASESLKELQSILDNFHNRSNMLYWVINILLVLDIQWVIKAEQWKDKNKVDLDQWFSAIGEFECMSSMAGFSYANPEFSFPTISDVPFTVRGAQVGHPLIKTEKRVSNDFDFSGKGGICLITGSNMSGKSTFLRTVGVNAVLALMGAPVCARSFEISYLKVFTSMRTQDDLEESVSSFYAELKRLKAMLSSIDGKTPILFMVDEVLKGTNSEDRHKGALALIRQLNKDHAFGFVSTHDIELGQITNELSGVKNYSFNNTIEGDEIIFDYTLTEGICKSFNATKLMQKMGIQIIE